MTSRQAGTPTGSNAGVNDQIPLVDLTWQYQQIRDEVEPEILDALANGRYVGGAAVANFESEFASYSGAAHCVGVANGTDAVELGLRAVGVVPGDDVVLPANTFIATAGAVARIGANPVLVDCGPDHLINPETLEAALGRSLVRAVVPVHLYGQMADMEAVEAIAGAARVRVVADGAQSQGALRSGRSMGEFATVTATSFYPGKNLGAAGDAGAVLTSDDQLARRVRLMANHGSEIRYHHEIVGMNSRLDHVQAIVLRAKLARLEGWNERRREIADRYDALLGSIQAVTRPSANLQNLHVWHLYVIEVDRRDQVLAHLNRHGVGASVHYPLPLHLQPAFHHLGHRRGDFPIAERVADRILSLPMFPGMTDAQVERVASVLADALASS